VLSELTRERLKAATVVYLSTDGRHIKSRLTGGKRPLLKNGFDDWTRIYDERKPIYESVADITINTSGQSLAATLAAIKEQLGVS
jgi:shikimate kinase